MPRIIRDNGLTIVLMMMFLVSIVGQWLAGWKVENENLGRHGEHLLTGWQYLGSASFISSVFENWESEFLQMSTYVVLTSILVQRGSSESRDPDKPPRDGLPEEAAKIEGSPGALQRGPLVRWLYAHSLGLTLFTLFVLSFVVHWTNSARVAAQEAEAHGETQVDLLWYLVDPQLWFESFQNWQSEFLSTAVLVVLSIFLRHQNSPESKALSAPNSQTGQE
ncbi:DUF6766 family protein [Sphingomonas kaistensis]|uniref:DUF6766 family protein n=1 Tax=Sphingomonas kaistensis TaxID=298708 RepID=A0ABZ2FWC8_9SPHN